MIWGSISGLVVIWGFNQPPSVLKWVAIVGGGLSLALCFLEHLDYMSRRG